MISLVNPNEVEQLLRPTVYRPSGGVLRVSDETRDLADGIREERHADRSPAREDRAMMERASFHGVESGDCGA